MTTDTAIVGAGPFGLSIATHLGASGPPPMVFGKALALWRDLMPEGMFLKSDGFASDLFDPALGQAVRQYAGSPRLDAAFMSSVPGLYFAGTIAANSFGPLMRFMVGAGFAARQIAAHITRTRDG